MGKIVIVGLGAGDLGLLSLASRHYLLEHGSIYLRTEKHPVVEQLRKRGLTYQSFDWLYEEKESFQEVYDTITEILLTEAEKGQVIYAVPGHPMVAETTVSFILAKCQQRGISSEVIPGISFLDACYHLLQIDPTNGLVVQDGLAMTSDQVITDKGQIICQVYNKMVASDVKLTLMDKLPDDHEITVIVAAGVPDMEKVIKIPLYQLDRIDELNYLTSLYIPPLTEDTGEAKRQFSLKPIVDVMAELRGPCGCPWDKEQNHQSLKKYLIEETYEVLEAIDEKNMHKLCDELGDLLLQVVFHAQIASENDEFDINHVVEAITTKMVRRHPHVFGSTTVANKEQVLVNWDEIKNQEQAGNRPTLSAPRGMPALMKGQKLQQQAAKVGFDWSDIKGVMAKIDEEWQELLEAVDGGEQEQIKTELGDVLFSVVNLARFLKVDAEEALMTTCDKFTKRFQLMEQECASKGLKLSNLTIEQLEKLWQNAKNVTFKGKN